MAQWKYDDGGRAKAGVGPNARDCVCRAIAIATGRRYPEVYQDLVRASYRERPGRKRKRSHPTAGVRKATIRRYLESIGWVWVPTMQIGTGCQVHLRASELPKGRLIVSLSKHLVAMVDGVVHDTADPRRGGTRCVYGYYQQRSAMLKSAAEVIKRPDPENTELDDAAIALIRAAIHGRKRT